MLTRDAPEQAALCHRLAEAADLVAIVLSQNRPRRPSPDRWRILWNRLQGRVVGRPFVKAWFDLQDHYRARHPAFPAVRTARVSNVNDLETLRVLEEAAPELVCVSSTNLVGRTLIEWASRHRGMINLHTGLSPYVKGGPNCTNWCLAEDSFHWIGTTVLWMDTGIDSGPILASEAAPLSGREDLSGLHVRVQEHANDLYARAVGAIRDGLPVTRCEQTTLAQGKTFYTRDWNGRAMRRALGNFQAHYTPAFLSSDHHRRQSEAVRTVALPARAEAARLDAGLKDSR